MPGVLSTLLPFPEVTACDAQSGNALTGEELFILK
jgi:hypothetical protein